MCLLLCDSGLKFYLVKLGNSWIQQGNSPQKAVIKSFINEKQANKIGKVYKVFFVTFSLSSFTIIKKEYQNVTKISQKGEISLILCSSYDWKTSMNSKLVPMETLDWYGAESGKN